MSEPIKEGFFAGIRRRMKENRAAVLAGRKSAVSPSQEAVPANVSGLTNGRAPTPAQANAATLRAVRALTAPDQGLLEPREEHPHANGSTPPGGALPAVIPELRRYAYVKWVINTLTLSVMVNVYVVVVLLVAGLEAGIRPQMQLTAPASLRREAEITFGKEDVNLDDMLLFINTVLPLMHRVDDRGSPDLPLLRGLVAPDIYARAQSDADRESIPAKKHFIVQNLVVTRIEDVEQDPKHGRVSCYVRGYLAIIIQSSGKSVILPYRAELLMEMAPPSRLNRFPFVLVKREWRIEQAALDWDRERTLRSGADDNATRAAPQPKAKKS